MKERISCAESVLTYNKRLIFDVLAKYEGTIAIVWDRLLMKQMNVIVTPRELTNQKVTRNFSLDEASHADTSHVVYFIAPHMTSVEKLIKSYMNKLPEHDLRLHHVLFVPEGSYVLKERLKAEAKIISRIESIKDLALNWFPNEQPDFLHLMLPALPCRMLVDGNWNYLYKCATALLQLEQLMPSVPSICCKGEWSARIVETLKKARASNQNTEKRKECIELDIGKIVIIDRWVDSLTPLLTQFTFGGSIDDAFSVDIQGKVKVPHAEFEENTESSTHQGQHKEITLRDEVYDELQNLHVNAVAAKLREIVRELKNEENQRQGLASIAEYKTYVDKLPQLVKKKDSTSMFMKLLGIVQRHQSDYFFVRFSECEQEILSSTNASEKIFPFIENSIIEARPATTILRLIALQSLVSVKGLKSGVFQSYRKLFTQSYGAYELAWWMRMQIAGLLKEEGAEGKIEIRYPMMNYPSMAKRFRLYCPEVDEISRSDTAFAYNGRASLLVRYIEDGLNNDWREFTRIGGTDGQSDGRVDIAIDSFATTTVISSAIKNTIGLESYRESGSMIPKTLLFVVGGLTRAELSALKSISPSNVCLYCTTANITGDSLIDSFKS